MDPKSKDEDGVGGMTSLEVISTLNSLEMEMGSGGHQVKLEEAGAAAVEGSKGQVKPGNLEGMEVVPELEGLVIDLHIMGDPQGKVMKAEFLSKLEKARKETADREKVARRIKWTGEVRLELLKRKENKVKMGSTPLGKVTDWKAKADMSKMSMEWRKAFKRDRTSFLFDKVFQTLFENTARESKQEAILTCRTVCNHWKRSVESFILSKFERGDNYWGDTNSMGAQTADYVPICVPGIYDKDIMKSFNFWSKHRYSGKNPFFSRRLSFPWQDVEWKDNLEFWKGAELLLRRWGSEIWVLWITFDKGTPLEVMYEQLVKYLKLMPNLRCLQIYDRPRTGSNSILDSLKSRIVGNPLPELPHLKHLEFQDCVVTPLVEAAVAKYGGSLEYLMIHESEGEGGGDPRKLITVGDLSLPQLKFLHFATVVSSRSSPDHAFDFNMKPPLLEYLSLMESNLEEGADVLRLFRNLHRFRSISTLREVSLAIRPTDNVPTIKLSDEQLRNLFLELPQLESFFLSVSQVNLKNIDFLLPCVSLKELKLTYFKSKTRGGMPKDKKVSTTGKGKKSSGDAGPSPPDEIIQFSQYTNRLYESNLWKLFPKLKMVTICVSYNTVAEWPEETKGKVYTRGGWKRYLGGGGGGSLEGISSSSLHFDMESGHRGKMQEIGEAEAKTGNLNVKDDETVLELGKRIKDLDLNGDLQGELMKVELLSNLEKSRKETSDREKAARRMKWKEAARTVMSKREEVKRKPGSIPLKKVKDWKTKANMSRISMEWREGFKRDRTSFLFNEVFPIIYEHSPLDDRTQVVVCCRPVSKAWKGITESCILPAFQRNYTPDGQIKSGVKGSHDRVCSPEFHSASGSHFWQRLYSGKNPFFAKRLSIIGGDVEWKDNLQFWKAGEMLLRQWGTEIWVLRLRFDLGMTFEVMYEQLVKYLKLMPNLRSFTIEDDPGPIRGAAVNEVFKKLGQDIYAPLKARIIRSPLPELPYLKSVWLQHHVMPPLAQAIFAKYGGTLEFGIMHESANGSGEEPMEQLAGKGLTLPHLHELNVTSYASNQGVFDLGKSCPSLQALKWKQCSIKGPGEFLTFFQNLNRLRPVSTLKRLWLTIQPTDWIKTLKLSEGQLKDILLDLPQLEMLSLNAVQVNLNNIDFLLPCVSLKDLDLTYQTVKDIRIVRKEQTNPGDKGMKNEEPAALPPPKDEIIQFSQYKDRLYESNLWKLFPDLKSVGICVATFRPKVGQGKGLHVGIDKMETKEYSKEGYKKYLADRGSCSSNPAN